MIKMAYPMVRGAIATLSPYVTTPLLINGSFADRHGNAAHQQAKLTWTIKVVSSRMQQQEGYWQAPGCDRSRIVRWRSWPHSVLVRNTQLRASHRHCIARYNSSHRKVIERT